MLGRYPRPYLDRTTSKSELHSTQSHEIVLFPPSEDEKPVLLPPHQIVIGFDISSENSKSSRAQASESPRSVLEPDHLCFRVHHRQSQSPRSPLSVLGSLLAGQAREGACAGGAALCPKVGADAEEVSNFSNAPRAYSKRGHGAGAYHSSSKTEHIACDVHCTVANGKTQPWSLGHTEQVFATASDYKTFLSRVCEDDDSDDGEDSSSIHVSLFSTASPVSDYSRHSHSLVDFLSKCFLCRRHLAQGKDIYMYRGDRAFCSQECRHRQMIVDKRKESCPVSVACVSRASTHLQTAQKATQAAIAT